jgi:hypothetical protein
MKLIFFFIFLIPLSAYSIQCDCEVRIYGPLTGPQTLGIKILKVFELEEFNRHSLSNHDLCRESCVKTFEKEVTSKRLKFELLNYSQELIEKNIIGYNCSGLTTLKFPIRTKAFLGGKGLGNVSDFIEVVSFEKACLD